MIGKQKSDIKPLKLDNPLSGLALPLSVLVIALGGVKTGLVYRREIV